VIADMGPISQHSIISRGPGGGMAREVTWERPMMTAAPDVKPAVTECDRKLVRKPSLSAPTAVYMHATMKDSWMARWLYCIWTSASSADTSLGLEMLVACRCKDAVGQSRMGMLSHSSSVCADARSLLQCGLSRVALWQALEQR
jgi:hypothetical protein